MTYVEHMVTRLRRDRSIIRLDHPATWDDLDGLPEDVSAEIVAGDIVVTPRPDLPHATVTSNLGILIGGPFRMGVGGPGGWILLDEPRIRFDQEIRVPDLAGWRRDRWVDVPRRGPIPLAPDWICEVLSHSTEAEDRAVKMPLYARAKVGHLWLLNATAAILEIYRLEPGGWLLVSSHAHPARLCAPPFDTVEIDFSPLWEEVDAEDGAAPDEV